MAATAVDPQVRAAGSLPDLQQLLDAAYQRFDDWAELVEHHPTANTGVVIDQAEDLRRLFRQAANGAYKLLTELRRSQKVTPSASGSYPPAILAVLAAAASFDAATQAISPVASGLRLDTQLRYKVPASLRATAQFLAAATNALTQTQAFLAQAESEVTSQSPHLPVARTTERTGGC
ncbi:hypothetical protein [Ornithinimicrobium cryptoxanthini]|uniref:Uncharacterized protein n=1 Tax=Ornithinimicrobium cryptoxanthini TaxID=2934161 RepID=A0ABY4YMK3_9MICO|nr:hypothetical protein [Ornithinimicrobium cryptoxanthini]USQ77824.1 hypothetical protein NF557_08020 [Ornithinimicrobium cryptoxanthini]